MHTQCISEQLRYEGFDGRRVEAAFDGGAACFRDGRDQSRVVHSLRTLIGQRIVGLALGYEDVNDHDDAVDGSRHRHRDVQDI